MEERNFQGYTEAFKRHVVQEVERGRVTQCQASRKYGILGHSTILKWCRKYGIMSHIHSVKVKRGVMTEQDRVLHLLRNENKALKHELEESRFKNVVLETLVDVAEQELHVPIRKKYGAKRSVK